MACCHLPQVCTAVSASSLRWPAKREYLSCGPATELWHDAPPGKSANFTVHHIGGRGLEAGQLLRSRRNTCCHSGRCRHRGLCCPWTADNSPWPRQCDRWTVRAARQCCKAVLQGSAAGRCCKRPHLEEGGGLCVLQGSAARQCCRPVLQAPPPGGRRSAAPGPAHPASVQR